MLTKIELREVEVDAVGEARGAERERVAAARRPTLPPKSSMRLRRSRATLQRLVSAAADRRHDLGPQLRHREDDHDADHERRSDCRRAAAGRVPAPGTGSYRSSTSTKGSAMSRSATWTMVSDTSSTAPAASASGGGHSHPLQEAEVHPDTAGRARHGQVDELDRRLQHDAREQRQRRQHGSADRDPGADERELREDQRDDDPGEVCARAARRRSCRSRCRRAG